MLSHAFFRKDWPRWELDGLTAREIDGRQLILPVWHGVAREDVTTYSPTLAGRVAARSCDGLERVVEQIIERIDDGRPLGPGLRGRVRLERGHFVYTAVALNQPDAASLDGLTAFIREGTLDRGPDGHIRARIDTLMGMQTWQRVNERMDLAVLCLESDADTVSTDPERPMVFRNRRTVVFGRGERLPVLLGPGGIPLPSDVTLEASTIVNAVLRGNRFEGTFAAELRVSGSPTPMRSVRSAGTFEATVA